MATASIPKIIPMESSETNQFIYRLVPNEMIRVGIIGALVGLLAAVLAGPMSRFIIEPVFCRGISPMDFCSQQNTIGFSMALVIVSVAALLLLVNWQTYQPMMNVIAPAAALWGLDHFLPALADGRVVEFYIFATILFMAAYELFYCLLRIKNIVVSLVVALLIVVAIRLQF